MLCTYTLGINTYAIANLKLPEIYNWFIKFLSNPTKPLGANSEGCLCWYSDSDWVHFDFISLFHSSLTSSFHKTRHHERFIQNDCFHLSWSETPNTSNANFNASFFNTNADMKESLQILPHPSPKCNCLRVLDTLCHCEVKRGSCIHVNRLFLSLRPSRRWLAMCWLLSTPWRRSLWRTCRSSGATLYMRTPMP